MKRANNILTLPKKFRLLQVKDYQEAQEIVKKRNCVDAYYLEQGRYRAAGNYLILVIEP